MTSRLRASLAALVALLALPTLAGAGLSGEILDFGRVAGRPGEDLPPSEGTGLSPPGTIEDVRHIERTDRIEARLCRSFGITVRLHPTPPLRVPREVIGRVLHPTMTRPDGRQGSEASSVVTVFDDVTYIGFTFDQDWEMVPGRWTLIVTSGEGELARKDFTITVPPAGSHDSDCGIG